MARRVSRHPYPSFSHVIRSHSSFLPERVWQRIAEMKLAAQIQTANSMMQTIDLRDENSQVLDDSNGDSIDNNHAGIMVSTLLPDIQEEEEEEDAEATTSAEHETDNDDGVTVFEVELAQDDQQLHETRRGIVKLFVALLKTKLNFLK